MSATVPAVTSNGTAKPPPSRIPNWYFDKKELQNTPSIRDGLDFQTVHRYRREGAHFIKKCGTGMGLGHNTVATGVVYFHRFYVFHSFKSFPRYVTACCCLFLAGKVEETPKKCRDIIRIARELLDDSKFASFGEDPKEEVMTLERILLQTIKFDLQVEHPHNFLVRYAKCLKGDQVRLQRMVQMAWNFVNDSLSTTVCLQWEPEIIAVALIHLASKLSKFVVTKWEGQQPSHLRWWDMFVSDVTMEILEDICHQVLDLYQSVNASDPGSPPQLPPSKSSPPASKRSRVSPPAPVAGVPPPPLQPPPPLMGAGGAHQQPPPPPPLVGGVRSQPPLVVPPPPPPPPPPMDAPMPPFAGGAAAVAAYAMFAAQIPPLLPPQGYAPVAPPPPGAAVGAPHHHAASGGSGGPPPGNNGGGYYGQPPPPGRGYGGYQ